MKKPNSVEIIINTDDTKGPYTLEVGRIVRAIEISHPRITYEYENEVSYDLAADGILSKGTYVYTKIIGLNPLNTPLMFRRMYYEKNMLIMMINEEWDEIYVKLIKD